MTRMLTVMRAGPGVTVQDGGRPGWLSRGLSRGGAADPLALAEGAALLGQPADLAALEMAGMGGEFQANEPVRIALTGAPMQAAVDGEKLMWNASYALPAGARLTIGPARAGTYGYLHLGGGVRAPERLGARSTHLSAGIGAALGAGDTLELGEDRGSTVGMTLEPEERFEGGTLRIVASLQTHLFPAEELERLERAELRRDARGNRMGVRLEPEGGGFHVEGGRNVLSEVIVPGDIQITGDGTPFVLLCECQTTGGYPRIGTVLPADLPRIAQARAGARLRFRFVELDEAVAIERGEARRRAGLGRARRPLVCDPHGISDLLSYQLISGAVSGAEED